MGSNLLLFGKRRMPNGTYGVVRGVRAISPPTRFFLCGFMFEEITNLSISKSNYVSRGESD